jgi:hypothetical protein
LALVNLKQEVEGEEDDGAIFRSLICVPFSLGHLKEGVGRSKTGLFAWFTTTSN